MDNSLLEKLETFYIRFREIGQLITDPEVIQDMKRYVRLTKEYKDLEEITAAGDQYKKALKMLEESKEILATEEDKELREMAEMEIADLTERLPQMEQDIKMLLIPADPEDSKTLFWKFGGGQEEMRLVCLQEICSGCMPSSVRRKVGNWRSPVLMKGQQEGIKKLLPVFQETECMVF